MNPSPPVRQLRQLVLGPLVLGLLTAVAAQAAPDDAVGNGREALRRRGSYPWYDPETDGVRRVDLPVTKPPSSKKTPNPPPDQGASRSRSNGSGSERGTGDVTTEPEPSDPPPEPPARNLDLGALSTVINVLVWGTLLLILTVLAYILIRAFLNREEKEAEQGTREADESVSEPVAQLPFAAPRRVDNMLAEAGRLYERGEYDLAIVYLYGYQLIELDRNQFLRLARGKTNRQYLRELGAHTELRELVSTTMIAFEDAFFGHHALGRERFEACWHRLEAFHSLAHGATPSMV